MKEIFKTVIKDFQERLPIPEITLRELDIPTNLNQVITLIGPRRCGKTFYFYSLINKLIDQGINSNLILYFNFEDERYDLTSEDLQILIDAYFELFPQNIDQRIYLFFDEIQEVDKWEKFIRRIKDTLNPYIFITGSSSKMLSTDIATTLRGRTITYNLYPFSYSEYCRYFNISTDEIHSTGKRVQLYSLFQDYLISGGYPETFGQSESIMRKILQSYFDVMLFKDIIERYQVSNNIALKQFIKHLASTISSEFSINKIYHNLKSSNIPVSKDRLYDYMGYTQDCFLFFLHYPLEFSVKKTLKARKKSYFIDNGLLTNITSNFSNNFGKLLENLIFIELKRREKEIYFYRNGIECDFIIIKNNNISQLIQVSYDISNKTTLDRELNSLLKLSDKYPDAELLLITNSTEKKIFESNKQIQIIPAWKWCLQ